LIGCFAAGWKTYCSNDAYFFGRKSCWSNFIFWLCTIWQIGIQDVEIGDSHKLLPQ